MIRGTSKSGRTTSRVSSCRDSWWLAHRRQAQPHSTLSFPSTQTSPPTCLTLRPSRRYSSSTGATTTEACLGEFTCHICVFCLKRPIGGWGDQMRRCVLYWVQRKTEKSGVDFLTRIKIHRGLHCISKLIIRKTLNGNWLFEVCNNTQYSTMYSIANFCSSALRF